MPLILTAEELRKVDAATIAEEGISSLDLMERAAEACADAITETARELYPLAHYSFVILCGRGNNGGDGWVISRLLHQYRFAVKVIDFDLGTPSPDNRANLRVATKLPITVRTLLEGAPLPDMPSNAIIIDAVFGTGLNRPVTGHWANIFDEINTLPNPVWSVDIPSGIFTDQATNSTAIHAERCFSLGYPKLAEFDPDNDRHYGIIERVDFSLVPADDYVVGRREILSPCTVQSWLRPRNRADHKGTYGHALLVAGSVGSIGAAVLAARAIMRSGAGKLTCHLPDCGYQVMQTSAPEAMCVSDVENDFISAIGPTDGYQVIGIGPGIGQASATANALRQLLQQVKYPIVLDADALNILAANPDWFSLVPPQSVLSPHPKEFDRLFGVHKDVFARWETQRRQAMALNVTILLKGSFSTVVSPDGALTFNPTGNPGMGTAGMGDVLTGIITGLMAQGYSPAIAARLGCYLHGLAGDLGADAGAMESLIASDVIEFLGRAFKLLRSQ